jgi:hypothetical protein
MEEWYRSSQEALDTITKMVVDIAEYLIGPSHADTATYAIDAMPPIYIYNARDALKHIHSSSRMDDATWLRNAENVLQTSLDKYLQRWSIRDSWNRV